MLAGMRAFGAPDEKVEQARQVMLKEAREAAAAASQGFEVWAENWDVFIFFMSLARLWQHIVVAGEKLVEVRRTGLDRPGVRTEAWLQGVPGATLRAWWPDIRAMEQAVMDEDRKLRADAQARGG